MREGKRTGSTTEEHSWSCCSFYPEGDGSFAGESSASFSSRRDVETDASSSRSPGFTEAQEEGQTQRELETLFRRWTVIRGSTRLGFSDDFAASSRAGSCFVSTLLPRTPSDAAPLWACSTQEAQLESFIRDAESQRKFEDASSLKLSLAEIRQEVQKIIAGTS